MSHWNYRVVQSYDRKEFFIAEVYYNDAGEMGWTEGEPLRWGNYDDLKSTVELLQKAFDRLLLQVGEGDELVEVVPV